LLKDILNLNEYIIAVIVLIAAGGVLFGLGFAFHEYNPKYIIGSVLLTFILFPILVILSMRIPREITTFFNTLHDNNAIGSSLSNPSDPKAYERFLQHLIFRVDSMWWAIGVLVLLTGYWLYRLIVVELPAMPPDQFWFHIALLALYSVMFYPAFFGAIRLVIALIYVNVLFRTFTINVNPLHPDNSGGLGILERMLGVSAAFLSTAGVVALVINTSFLFGTMSFFSLTEAIVIGAVYIILGPVLILGWLLSPHQVMLEACNATLKPLADQFQSTYTASVPKASDDAEAIKKETDRLFELKRRYDLLHDNFPVWPASIRQVVRLSATVSLPALLPVFTPVIAVIVTFFQKHPL
ncbi:MAG: hypothetical protein JO125_04655, partial [Chloroflexi bacterium]|nr:hypothetical protein [Chloroflexota bacterium]